MKVGKVVPIFKKGDKDDITNYRPISLLPSLSKILEQLVTEDLRAHLEANHVIHDDQYGFRAKSSTAHAMYKKLVEIEKCKKEKGVLMSILVDLSRAFDSLAHDILLYKLEKYGAKNNELKWLGSYLENRSQYVEFMDVCSERLRVELGVPQGGKISTLLFLAFIADLPCITELLCILFADDTSIILKGANMEELKELAERELPKIEQWFVDNGLKVHPDKTRYLLYNTKAHMDVYLSNKKLIKIGPEEEEKECWAFI